MVIDSSALLSILLLEEDAERYAEAISNADDRYISSFSSLECSAVLLARKGPVALQSLQALFFRARLEEVAFSPEQSIVAVEAYRQFGRGRHAANLNIGDCCSYALAKSLNQALLFKGDDFSKTDVVSVL